MIDIPVRVRDALKSGMYKKNYRVIVYDKNDNELEVLDNNRLITESVKIDERMCSGKVIKFGLCEGTSLDFQYFDYDNISGKRIKLMLDIEYLDADGVKKWYELPMGYYNVDSCSRQFSTGIYKASCFNKLKSEYLDQKVTEEIKEIVSVGEIGLEGSASIDTILAKLLDGYSIETEYTRNNIEFSYDSNILSDRADIQGDYRQSIYIPYVTFAFEIPDYEQDAFYRIRINKDAFISKITELIGEYGDAYVKDVDTPDIYEPLRIYARNQNYMWRSHRVNSLTSAPLLYMYAKQMTQIVTYMYIADDEEKEVSEYFTNAHASGNFYVRFPLDYIYYYSDNKPRAVEVFNMKYPSYEERQQVIEEISDFLVNNIVVEKRNASKIGNMYISTDKVQNLADVTLRELQSAVFEMNCQFGRLDRNTDLFSGLTLNNGRLVPSDTLYPSDDLYPQSNAERTDSSSYEKLWTDNVGVQRFRYLIITYKGIVDGQEKDIVLQRTVNPDGTTDYNMSSNWLFKNLVWTEEQVAEYADAMVELMREVSWFPFEMWSAGLPYLEPGDEIEIGNSEGTYTSYILQRQLSGIQMLKDTFINGELDIF